TSCWLFIGAQHPNAHGATLHYASPRLTRDVPQLMENLATDFCSAIEYAKDLRRYDLADLHSKLDHSKKEKEALEAEMQAIVAEKVSQEEVLRVYRDKFGIIDLEHA
ncbi:hypothetical protein BDN70DRAFT_812119, partial [Pholiota conissans]